MKSLRLTCRWRSETKSARSAEEKFWAHSEGVDIPLPFKTYTESPDLRFGGRVHDIEGSAQEKCKVTEGML